MPQGRRLKGERHRPSLAQETAWPTTLPQEWLHMRRTLPALLSFLSRSLHPCRRPAGISSARDAAQNPGAKFQNCENVSLAAGCETGSCHCHWRDRPLLLERPLRGRGARGALNTPRPSAPGCQATHRPWCKGCCYFGFINDWAESCISKELYPNHLQFGGEGSAQNLDNLHISPLGHMATHLDFKISICTLPII